jgi:hypothetical protein
VPLRYSIEIPPGGFVTLGGELKRLAEDLAKDVSDRAAAKLKNQIRQDMAGARLGRLGQAITHTSDKRRGGNVYRRGEVSRASGIVYIRTRSPRTVGAIISYTEGANILPNKGRYLWYPLESAQRIVGRGKERRRLTPSEWASSGLLAKLGPLIQIKGSDGLPILGVRNVGIGQVKSGRVRPRSLTKSGRPRKGDAVAEFVPIFKGILRTSRAARVNVRQRAFEAAQQAAAELRGV